MRCTLEHCLSERRTPQRPYVWQAADVVTEARHNNKFHWPWFRDWWISNRCSAILTRRRTSSMTDRTPFFCKECVLLRRPSSLLPQICMYRRSCAKFSMWLMWIPFISKPNGDSVIQRLFWASETCTADCFSQSFTRRLKFSFLTAAMRDVLHWLSLRQRIYFKLCHIVGNCVVGTAPVYLQELCVPVREVVQCQRLRSATYSDLCVPRVATDRFGWPAFSVTGPQLWNQLPVTIWATGAKLWRCSCFNEWASCCSWHY